MTEAQAAKKSKRYKTRYPLVFTHLVTCKESPRRAGGFPVKQLNASMREQPSTPWLHARQYEGPQGH